MIERRLDNRHLQLLQKLHNENCTLKSLILKRASNTLIFYSKQHEVEIANFNSNYLYFLQNTLCRQKVSNTFNQFAHLLKLESLILL